jgi:hypothetical protein
MLGSLRIVDAPVVKICERMGRCWISTIGYRVKQIPTEFVVYDSYRSLCAKSGAKLIFRRSYGDLGVFDLATHPD